MQGINGKGIYLGSKLHTYYMPFAASPYSNHIITFLHMISDIRNNVLVSNSSYRDIKEMALFIPYVWGEVTVTGMDIRHVTNSALSIYGNEIS